MAQVTIYIDDHTEKRLAAAARAKNISKSKWISMLIREKTESDWPDAVVQLAGAWKRSGQVWVRTRLLKLSSVVSDKFSCFPSAHKRKTQPPESVGIWSWQVCRSGHSMPSCGTPEGAEQARPANGRCRDDRPRAPHAEPQQCGDPTGAPKWMDAAGSDRET